MTAPFIGEIQMFAGNFAPRGYALCDGQLLPVSQNSALFSLLGTTWGGDGRTTFALPDLRGRACIEAGQSPGGANHVFGSLGGVETVTLTQAQMASHNHNVGITSAAADSNTPVGHIYANAPANRYSSNTSNLTALNPATITNNGGTGPHDNMMPYLVINFIIALEGIYPSRT